MAWHISFKSPKCPSWRGFLSSDLVTWQSPRSPSGRSAAVAYESSSCVSRCAKWTVATYLPFLWRPEVHMYPKPEATKDFAARVGHPLSSVYEAQLNLDVYASLLDLAERTSNRLSDFRPHDRIDIQSFIWVVGAYSDEREEVYPQPRKEITARPQGMVAFTLHSGFGLNSEFGMAVIRQRPRDLSAAFLSRCSRLAKTCSIKFRSGSLGSRKSLGMRPMGD